MKKSAVKKETTLGTRLREFRTRNNMTLQQVSELCHVSVATLSKFENGKTGLSFRNVLQLAEGLRVPISMFMENKPVRGTAARMAVVRSDTGQKITEPQLVFEKISGNLKNLSTVFFRVTVMATSRSDYEAFHIHSGEEFFYVLSGTVELHTESYETVVLSTGDGVSFDSGMGHLYVSISDEPAVLLMSNSLNDEHTPFDSKSPEFWGSQ